MKKVKLLINLFTIIVLELITVSVVTAASLSVRISEPKTPTAKKDFEISFVALDIESRTVVVSCFKKAPGEGSFSQFGASINFPSGGGSGNCDVNSSIVTSDGTYTFYVKAVAGAEEMVSDSVSVDVNTSGPGTPVSYSKEKTGICEYKIKFKTADDGGKTKKVEIYRSIETSFNLDSGSRVTSISVGSNEEREHYDTVPDCSKEYYYAIRAFGEIGIGSGAIGDSIVRTTTITETTVIEGQMQSQGQVTRGPIAVLEGESYVASPTGEFEREAEEEIVKEEEGEKEGVLGAETKEQKINYVMIGVLVIVIAVIAYVAYRKKKG